MFHVRGLVRSCPRLAGSDRLGQPSPSSLLKHALGSTVALTDPNGNVLEHDSSNLTATSRS
jgi:hypothetical protein